MLTLFKPQLLPNNEMGVDINWEERIKTPTEWLYSPKLDGARVELIVNTNLAYGRSLKIIPSTHIQLMTAAINSYNPKHIIEGEFYSPNMTFPEIMHFFRTSDISSSKTKERLDKLWEKSKGGTTSLWEFPGRSVKWLTTWHSDLKFHVFDYVVPNLTKEDRLKELKLFASKLPDYIPLEVITQKVPDSLEDVYTAFDKAILNNYEGLVLIKRNSLYKTGRITVNENVAYKLKNDNKQFDGVILDVLEATEAIEGAEKTINELGRSVTSKLQENRQLSGIAKGFLVLMADGTKLTVSLKGFTQEDKKILLSNPEEYIGKTIIFTGMSPVKVGGAPRHAHFTKGFIRDDK